MRQIASLHINMKAAALYFMCFAMLLSSCSEKDDPMVIVPVEDTYAIILTGDYDKFKGSISVSTTGPNCYFESSSFEDTGSKNLSDSRFNDIYEFTFFNYDKTSDYPVRIHCSALCISDNDYSMQCSIYVMKMDGRVLNYEKEFVSFRPGSKPTSQEYTFTLEI